MRAYAFYLPQFHPIPENDNWWGEGFTEWTNVRKAKPRFNGHWQPHIPTTLGYYDLRDPSVYFRQIAQAKEYGIDGFIYYHYWFHGKRLLDKPVTIMLESNSNFPFAICWANETWSRAWDGKQHKILIQQTYSVGDHRNHARVLAKLFIDQRYIKVENRPLFIIYMVDEVEYFEHFLGELQLACKRIGCLRPFICGVKSSLGSNDKLKLKHLDAIIDFQPSESDLPEPLNFVGRTSTVLKRVISDSVYQFFKTRLSGTKRIKYREYIEKKIASSKSDERITTFPCCFPSWDNTARRRTSIVIQNTCSADFGKWLDYCFGEVKRLPKERRLVFINAWNEWAEGCHLEPDERMGYAFLEQVAKRKLKR